MDVDYALSEEKTIIPLSSDDEKLAEKTEVYETNKEKQEHKNSWV
jgi:hypothetical protein